MHGKKVGKWYTFVFEITPSSDTVKHCIAQSSYKAGLLDGTSTISDVEGNIMFSTDYKNGLLDGKVIHFYPGVGKLKEVEEHYKGGKKYGEFKRFDKTGKVVSKNNYKNDLLDGLCQKFSDNGKVEEEIHFVNGVYHGIYRYYHPNGKVWLELEYKDGLVWNAVGSYDKAGNKKEVGSLKNGDGTVIYYNEDGSVRTTVLYEKGEEVREW